MNRFASRAGSFVASWRSRLTILGLLAAASLGLPGAASADTLADYLVQQVCDNGAGGHTGADPITCPAMARKLRAGESLPYHKWDTANPGTSGQISDSYPIMDVAGRTRVVQTFYFGQQGPLVNPVFDASSVVTNRTGYDLLLYDGNYVSGAGTYDTGRGWQPLWTNSACSLADSWIMAPKNLAVPFGQGSATGILQNAAPQCPSVTSFGQAFTTWNYYGNIQYVSGKSLPTIKVFHFGGPSVNAPSIEMFYFTKAYGKTRWEAWSSTVSAADPGATGRCPTGTNNGVSYFGYTTYYLIDCHDWSNIVTRQNGDWNPKLMWHVDPLYYSVNALANTHMQCKNSNGQAQDCFSGGVCQTLTPWQLYGNVGYSFDSALQGTRPTANCALRVGYQGAYTGQSVYQDRPVPNVPYSSSVNYSYGAALWSPAGSAGTASVAVFQLNSSGGVLSQHSVQTAMTNAPKFVTGNFVIHPAAVSFRFQVYLETPNVTYEMTDAWIAKEP